VAWSSRKKKKFIRCLNSRSRGYFRNIRCKASKIWNGSLFQEREIDLSRISIYFFSDNQAAAIAIAHHPEFHARFGQIQVDNSYYFLRDPAYFNLLPTKLVSYQTKECWNSTGIVVS
jgi:hypothetical protein